MVIHFELKWEQVVPELADIRRQSSVELSRMVVAEGMPQALMAVATFEFAAALVALRSRQLASMEQIPEPAVPATETTAAGVVVAVVAEQIHFATVRSAMNRQLA